MRRVVASVLVSLLTGTGLVAATDDPDCPSEICERLWAIDQANLRWIANLVRAQSLRSAELDALARRGELLSAGAPRDLGFGALRRDFRLPARGNLDFTIRVVEHWGRVAIASFRTEIANAPYVALWPYFEWKDLGLPASIGQPRSGGMEIRFEDAEVDRRRRFALEEALGRAAYVAPTDSEIVLAAFDLSDPLADLVVGAGCNGGGDAARNVATLVDAAAWERLGEVLRGANPEGRLLALRALDAAPSAARRDEETRQAMRTVGTSPLPIRVCERGEVRYRAAREAPVVTSPASELGSR